MMSLLFMFEVNAKKPEQPLPSPQSFHNSPEGASKLKVNLCYANVPKMTVLTQLLGLSIYIYICMHINPTHSLGHLVCDWLEWVCNILLHRLSLRCLQRRK